MTVKFRPSLWMHHLLSRRSNAAWWRNAGSHFSARPTTAAARLWRRSPGFSGADLANLVNEAAILAARRNKKTITQPEFTEAVDVQSKALGFDPAIVYVAHPIQNRTKEELARLADDAIEPVLRLLKSA